MMFHAADFIRSPNRSGRRFRVFKTLQRIFRASVRRGAHKGSARTPMRRPALAARPRLRGHRNSGRGTNLSRVLRRKFRATATFRSFVTARKSGARTPMDWGGQARKAQDGGASEPDQTQADGRASHCRIPTCQGVARARAPFSKWRSPRRRATRARRQRGGSGWASGSATSPAFDASFPFIRST